MKILIAIFFLTFSFNSYSDDWKESWKRGCNDSLNFLKDIGFNFSSYTYSDPIQIYDGILCGTADGYVIVIKTKPIYRIYFTDSRETGYCVHFSGKYEKIDRKDC